jgi:hypothetical protein
LRSDWPPNKRICDPFARNCALRPVIEVVSHTHVVSSWNLPLWIHFTEPELAQLSEPSCAMNARRISEKMQTYGGAPEAARLIEDFI